MIRNILYIIISLILVSCYTPKKAKKNFTYCFDNKSTGLDSLLELNGFYFVPNKSDSNKSNPIKSQLSSYIFYNNRFVTTKFTDGWLQADIDDKYSFFGLYDLSNDTIKVQFLSPPDGMTKGKFEVWFKIINKQTIDKIYQGQGYPTEEDLEEFQTDPFYQEYGYRHYFYPLEKRPNIKKTYIIKRNWFWCNKETKKKYFQKTQTK